MKRLSISLWIGLSALMACSHDIVIPSYLLGEFEDDYGIRYAISDTIFTMIPNYKYYILEWNLPGQFVIARNDQINPSDPGLFSKIEWIELTNMYPYEWAFCISVYNGNNPDDVRNAAVSDKLNPRRGCNGFPFSRMKRIKQVSH